MPASALHIHEPRRRGELEPADQILPIVYEELRRLARARVSRRGPSETLTPTELVHEAYVRLSRRRRGVFEGRRHFFFAAARAMRDILVEKARRKDSLKRGGGAAKVSLDGVELAVVAPRVNLLDLDRALARLEAESPGRLQVVMLSYFGGLTHPEIAEVLGISRATVERRWAYAKAWLRRELTCETKASAA